jgi:hypothetical protein
MSETLKKILKFISRSFGFLFVNLAVVLIILAFFANSSINNIDSLKNDLQNTVQEKIFAYNIEDANFEKVKEYCNINKEDERCIQLTQLNQTNQFDQLFGNIESTKSYINLIVFAAIILLLFGFLLVYFGTFSLLITLYKISLHLSINNFLAALSFKLIPDILNSFISSPYFYELTKQAPKELINDLINVILNWIKLPIFITIKLTVTLGIIFLIITVILYFVKKKTLKAKDKGK